MPEDNDVKKEIRNLFEQRKKQEKNKDNDKTSGNVKHIKVGRDYIVDRRSTIIINQGRRSDDRINEQQQQEIKKKVDYLIKLDCVIEPALNPDDQRNFAERRNSSRRKRWNALRRKYFVKSYKDLTQADYPKVIEWLDRQRDKTLARINSPPQKKSAGKSLRLLSIFIVSIAVLLSLSLVKIPAADPNHGDVTGPEIYKPPNLPNIITADLINNTKPLTVIHYRPGLHAYAGCSLIRPSQPLRLSPSVKSPRSI